MKYKSIPQNFNKNEIDESGNGHYITSSYANKVI